MPYSGVMWVALPVACKRKETSSDTVDEAEMMTSFLSPSYIHIHTHTHTHAYSRNCIHSTYQPESSHTQLGQIWGLFRWYLFTVKGVKFIEYSGLGQNQKCIIAVAGLCLKVVRRGSDDTKGQLSPLKCFKSLPDILQIRCCGFMQCCKAK